MLLLTPTVSDLYGNITNGNKGVHSPSQLHQPTYKYQSVVQRSLALSFSNSFSFFFCFIVIGLALWSQPGSRPRISPQRHNYHTGLNVPPTSHGTHQSRSVLSPNLFSSGSFDGSLSIICMFYSHTLPVWSSFPIPHFSATPSFHHYAGNDRRWALLFLRRGEGCPWLTVSEEGPHVLFSSDTYP